MMFGKLMSALRAVVPLGTPQVRQADPSEIRRWWEDGAVVLIDVREPEEHAGDSIAGAINLPLSQFDPAAVPQPDRHLVLHCQRGVRCGPAAARLVAAGWPGKIVRKPVARPSRPFLTSRVLPRSGFGRPRWRLALASGPV